MESPLIKGKTDTELPNFMKNVIAKEDWKEIFSDKNGVQSILYFISSSIKAEGEAAKVSKENQAKLSSEIDLLAKKINTVKKSQEERNSLIQHGLNTAKQALIAGAASATLTAGSLGATDALTSDKYNVFPNNLNEVKEKISKPLKTAEDINKSYAEMLTDLF